MKHFKNLPLANVFMNHNGNSLLSITLFTSRPAVILGTNDDNVNNLKNLLVKRFPGYTFSLEVKEVKKPELSASIVADSIARQIEKKMPYRRVIKNAIAKTMEKGGLGIKVKLGGRLNGAEIARTEWYSEGKVPLHTLRADIDYGFAEANTTYGKIGIKVWINRGEIMPEAKKRPNQKVVEEADR